MAQTRTLHLDDRFITDVIAAHGMWKYRLHDAIETGSSAFSPEKIAVDNQCQLGQWIHGDARRMLGDAAAHEQLRDLHASFHRTAADVLRLALAGERGTARAQISSGSPFLRTSAHLVQILDGLRAGSVTGTAGAHEDDPVRAELVGTALETSAQADVASIAAEQVRANVEAVAAAAEEMSAAIGEVSASANAATQVAAGAVESAEEASAMVDRLARATGEIDKVLSLITAIAKQTNLLALNATIEAARAGDAGKGFAVVATEVKQLARETADAADDVAAKVAEINSSVTAALAGIAKFTETTREIYDTQTTIAGAVEEQNAATNEITRNMAETATAGAAIAENVAAVGLAARNTRAIAGAWHSE